ncbi:hypothetical protein [Dactylosporangium sp. NPDC049140]|uniref:hypothetical protein n=1 Tax=Dactylosporangium sp. NPDC049140 TaxID=3155647 RepID=UPI0033CD67C4
MTRGRFTLLIPALLLAALLLTGAYRWWAHPASAGCSGAGPRAVGAAVPVQGGLAVAEQGFSRVGGWSFSAGALVVDRSPEWAAYRTTVSLRLLDSSGGVVVALPERTLPMVLPGSRLPVGAVIEVAPDRAASVAGFSLAFGTTHWVRPEPWNPLFRRFDVLPEPDGPGAPDFLLPANMGPVACEGLSPAGAALVYRNGAGAVIGGEGVAYSGEYCAGTHAGDTVTAAHMPPTTDPPRTEIAIYCDVG